MKDTPNRSAAGKNGDRRRKRVRLYTVMACRRDDPSDLYGVMFCRRKDRYIVVADKNRCVFWRAVKADESSGGAMQNKWNECAEVARLAASLGRKRKKVRYVSKPPSQPDFPGTCYYAAETTVKPHFRTVYVRTKKVNRLKGKKRMPIEDFRFFVTRIWSKRCPIEFGAEDDRALRAMAYGYRSFKGRPSYYVAEFSAKKDFDFKWGCRAAAAASARRDHEPGSAEPETRIGSHKPVNPVTEAVNVLRTVGIQNPVADEMRKGVSPKRSGSGGDARAPARNSESAALSEVSAAGKPRPATSPFYDGRKTQDGTP
jgi:hypothetical protein